MVKTMKKYISIIIMAAVMAVTASCGKDIEESTDGTMELTVNGILDEYQPHDATRASLVNNIRVAWASGDAVLVFDSESKYLGALTAAVNPQDSRVARLSGTILSTDKELRFVYGTGLDAGSFTVGSIQSSVSISLETQGAQTPFMVYGTSDFNGTAVNDLTVNFKFATSVISTYITGLPASKDISSVTVSGINTKCSISISDAAIGGNTSGSIVKTGMGSSNPKGQAYVEIAVPISFTSPRLATAVVDGSSFEAAFASSSLNAGYSYNTMLELKAKAPFLFSVSNTTKVIFSSGNLYWDGNAFKFEDHQYDYNSSWSASHVTHFNWSNTAAGAYAETALTNDHGSDALFTNATATTPNASFTVANETGVWRTLSESEWNYIATQNRWGAATVNSIKGIVLLPDSWTTPENCHFTTGCANGFNTNIITLVHWAALESAGAVFLPCAGLRDSNNANTINSSLNRYLASDKATDPEHQGDWVQFISFNDNGQFATMSGLYSAASPIRLVKDHN